MAERGEGARTALLGVAVLVLLLASVAVLVFVDFGDDSSSTSGTPSATSSAPADQRSGNTKSTQPSGPPQPVSNACNLVSVESVASAIGAKPADVKPEPANQANGLKCDFKAPEGEDVLVGFTVQLVEASFARATIEARNGKRIDGLGEVAVLEQSDVSSQISVVKGSRYVQLQARRRPASDDAMIDLGRQAAAKL